MFVLQEVWGKRIVLDLFFGGMGAGAFIIGYYLYLKGREKMGLRVSLAGVVSLMAGLAILVTHLGKPEAAVWAVLTPQPGSVMAWGIFFNTFFMLFGLAFAGTLLLPSLPWGSDEKVMKLLGGAASAFAFLVMSYTGALLASTSIPLWRNPGIPVLFILVSISSGAGLYMAVSHLSGSDMEPAAVYAALVATIGVAIVLASMIVIAPVAHAAYSESICMMLGAQPAEDKCVFAGSLAPLFYTLVVAGIAAPLAALTSIIRGRRDWVVPAAALLLMLQSLAVRYLIVSAGIAYLPW